MIVLYCLGLFFVCERFRVRSSIELLSWAQQVVSELPGLAWDFLKIQRARDLIRWRSCVDLLSEVLVFVGSCVDLRRTQGGLEESVVE